MSTIGYLDRWDCSHPMNSHQCILTFFSVIPKDLKMTNCAVFSYKVIQSYWHWNIRLWYFHCWGGGFHCREYHVWEYSSPGTVLSFVFSTTNDRVIVVGWEADVCESWNRALDRQLQSGWQQIGVLSTTVGSSVGKYVSFFTSWSNLLNHQV